MTIRNQTEIRLMVEFLWRTVFGYSNFLQHKQQFNREFCEHLISRLLLTGTSILHTMSPAEEMRTFTPGPELTETSKAFTKSYNEFLANEWRDIMTAGFPKPLEITKLEIALGIRIDHLTETICSIYQKQEA